MDNRNKLCKDRVGDSWNRTRDDLKQLIKLYKKDPERYDDDLGRLEDYALSFDYVAPGTFSDQRAGFWRYQISTGGPGTEIRYYENGDIEYWLLDWFDGACVDVTDDEIAQWIWDWLEPWAESEKQKSMEY